MAGDERERDDVAVEATRWLADARIDEAARARSRQRWLRQQAEEGATFVGLLLALVEAAAIVTLVLDDESAVEGTLTAVAADYVAVTGADQTTTFVTLASVAALRTSGDHGRAADDARRARSERRLWDVIAEAAADRPNVVIRTGGRTVRGVLTAVGVDVLTVAGDQPGSDASYVPAGSLSSVSLGSG